MSGANYQWGDEKPYNSYSSYIKRTFSSRIQKLSINAGFTCPNRDGTKGFGGCIYCNNTTFNPAYCEPYKTVTEQITEGVRFFSKYQAQSYLAYFQAYTNTYSSFDTLKALYTEALSHPAVKGLVIATRPDCIDNQILEFLKKFTEDYYIVIEYGIETTNDITLSRINRHHTFEDVIKAIKLTSETNIHIGGHLILGLPGEDHEMIVNHARILSELPIEFLKLHQLQVIKETQLAKEYEDYPNIITNYKLEEYIDLVIDFLELLNPEIIVERFVSESPANLLIYPAWGLKNFEFVSKLEKRMILRKTWQGRSFKF